LALSSPDDFFSSIGLWFRSTIHPQSIVSLSADIPMSTIHTVHPPICWITALATVPGDLIYFHDLIQMNGALKMVSSVGGLSPGPIGHESSALPLDHEFLVVVEESFILQVIPIILSKTH
jgi:hypothetical protein